MYVIFGYLYRSSAIIPEDGLSSDPAFENPREPSGQPGSRAAHVMLERAGERLSTLDIFNGQWALLVGPNGEGWQEAAAAIKAADAFALQCYRIASDGKLRDVDNRWGTVYEVNSDGAVLVRPDGFIAWRAQGTSEHPNTVLRDVLERLSFRDPVCSTARLDAAY